MPTYEYVCTSCGDHTEAVQAFSDEPLQVCGICGGSLRRVFHPVGVLFKGSGFYSTDSGRRKSQRSGATKPDGTKSGGETQSSDSKPSDGKAPKASSKPPESKSSEPSSKASSEKAS